MLSFQPAQSGQSRAEQPDGGWNGNHRSDEIDKHGIKLATIEPGKPWQNGSNESFNGTFRKECLNAEVFGSLMEARVLIARWRKRYNEHRPHSSQGYITPEMAYFGLREFRKT